MNTNMITYVSRYVVPFYFEYENNGYERLRDHFLDGTKDLATFGLPVGSKWIESSNFGEKKQEMDVYSYLPTMFLEDKKIDGTDVSNIGDSFVIKRNENSKTGDIQKSPTEKNERKKLVTLDYKIQAKNKTETNDTTESGDKYLRFFITEMGVLIFRNGIGFIWYSIEFKNEPSLEEYVRFHNLFKELARTEQKTFYRVWFVKNKEIINNKEVNKEHEKRDEEPFVLGKWISQLLSIEGLEIRFWAERETKSDKANIPDKALLYQYLFLEQTTEHIINNLAFQVANGYNAKYVTPKDFSEKLYRPFGNVNFYMTNAGLSCVVNNDGTNKQFFTENFRSKMNTDYFFIYLLLSYQSYSCAHYARLLTKLPADENLLYRENKYLRKLESLNEQINLFLVKSVFESVSNIHHQNGMYRYGKKVLRIEDDVRSLTIGLSALEEIEKEKRNKEEQERKEAEREAKEERYRSEQKIKEAEKEQQDKRDGRINLALIIFGFMVVVSAWIDGLNLVDWFMKNHEIVNVGHVVISAGIIILTVYLIYTLLRNRNGR